MSIQPFSNSFNSIVFSIIFFGLTFLLTIKPTKVMDIIGKFLTPVLIALGFLIFKGVTSPIGELKQVSDNNLFLNGITQGYQTMDALGIGGVTALIISYLVSKGYTNKEENAKMAVQAACIAGLGLILIYGGLAYLGATVSTIYDDSISRNSITC